MHIELSPHAQEECQRRSIPVDFLEELITVPQQKVASYGNRTIYQSKFMIDGRLYLIRAVIDEIENPIGLLLCIEPAKLKNIGAPIHEDYIRP